MYLDFRVDSSRMWHPVQALLTSLSAINFVASLAISTPQSLMMVLENLADEFSRPTALSGHLCGTELATVGQNLVTDDEFTMDELQHALIATRKTGAPGCDDIANQALKNLNSAMLPLVLDEYN